SGWIDAYQRVITGRAGLCRHSVHRGPHFEYSPARNLPSSFLPVRHRRRRRLRTGNRGIRSSPYLRTQKALISSISRQKSYNCRQFSILKNKTFQGIHMDLRKLKTLIDLVAESDIAELEV